MKRDDEMLCYCKNVRYGAVRRSIARTDARDVDTVTRDCDAGSGCRTCHPEIEDLLEEHRQARGGFFARLRALFRSKS